tara:strand:+ start:2238 stop:3554 length:1317 start_codon:yes stop_codon:yes gene_type:complete
MAAKNLAASGVLYTDRRDFYIDPQVVKELWTDVAPFTTVISNKETRNTNDPVFKMFEHRNPWVKQKFSNAGETVTLAADGTESAALNIDGITGLDSTVQNAWEGLVCEIWNEAETAKKAIVLITDAVDADEIKVKCLWTTGGGDYTLVDNDVYHVIGNAQGEGETSPEAWSDELKVVYNSTQIFKTPLEITGTLLQASLRGESSELARLRLQKNQEHKMQKEKAFLFGARVGGTGLGESYDGTPDETFADGGRTGAGGGLVRTTYGIVSALDYYGNTSGDDQNIFTVGDAYKYGSFVDDMEKVFQYVPVDGVKKAFCGAGALGYWSKMAGSEGFAGGSGWTVNLSDMKRDSLGFNYKVLETPHGILQLIPTPALRGPYNKYMLVMDESNVFHAQYRSPMYQTNIKTDNGYDGVKDQYFSDEGLGISLIESHSLFKITA